MPKLVLTPSPEHRTGQSCEAQDLTWTMTVTVEGQTAPELLADGDYSTKLSLPAGTEIELQSEGGEISGLYMIWDTVPGLWVANTGAFFSFYGGDGFLHEFAELPASSKNIKISLTQDSVLCDIYVFSDGRLPEDVQLWQPSVERADILLFPTHGDDEYLFFGGIIPYYAGELGLSVQVVYLTNHWQTPLRPHEQLNGLWTGGLTAYPVFSEFTDYYAENLTEARSIYDESDIIKFQVEMIRRFQPQVIVDHDENGEYGHGVHRLNTYCIKTAVENAASKKYDGGSLERYGTWDTPKLYLHLLTKRNLSLDFDQPLERFGGHTAFQVAEECFAKHISQQDPVFFVYPKGHIYDCSSFGLFRTTVGKDVEKNDLMEHLIPYEAANGEDTAK